MSCPCPSVCWRPRLTGTLQYVTGYAILIYYGYFPTSSFLPSLSAPPLPVPSSVVLLPPLFASISLHFSFLLHIQLFVFVTPVKILQKYSHNIKHTQIEQCNGYEMPPKFCSICLLWKPQLVTIFFRHWTLSVVPNQAMRSLLSLSDQKKRFGSQIVCSCTRALLCNDSRVSDRCYAILSWHGNKIDLKTCITIAQLYFFFFLFFPLVFALTSIFSRLLINPETHTVQNTLPVLPYKQPIIREFSKNQEMTQ